MLTADGTNAFTSAQPVFYPLDTPDLLDDLLVRGKFQQPAGSLILEEKGRKLFILEYAREKIGKEAANNRTRQDLQAQAARV